VAESKRCGALGARGTCRAGPMGACRARGCGHSCMYLGSGNGDCYTVLHVARNRNQGTSRIGKRKGGPSNQGDCVGKGELGTETSEKGLKFES